MHIQKWKSWEVNVKGPNNDDLMIDNDDNCNENIIQRKLGAFQQLVEKLSGINVIVVWYDM